MNKNVKRAFAALGVALGIADVKTVGMELETASGETLELKKESGEPKVGDEVVSPDGEYVMPDGSTIVVAGGVITEIRPEQAEPAAEPAKVDEVGGDPLEETTEEKDKEIGDLEAEVERLKGDIEERDRRIEELEAEVERLGGEVKTKDEAAILKMVALAGGRKWLERAKSEYKPAKVDKTPTTRRVLHRGDELEGIASIVNK